MVKPNFSTKKQIDSYLKALDKGVPFHWTTDVLEQDYVPDLGNVSFYQKKKNTNPISRRTLYFQKLRDIAKKCQLCDLQTNNLVVDHEHSSGKIRGVLCQNCNHGLGKFMDNPELMEKAANYVRNFNRDEAIDYRTLRGPSGAPTEPADAFK